MNAEILSVWEKEKNSYGYFCKRWHG